MADDAFTPILRSIQTDLATIKADQMAFRTETNSRLSKIENDIAGLMEILVGIAGTLRALGDRVRRLEEKEKA